MRAVMACLLALGTSLASAAWAQDAAGADAPGSAKSQGPSQVRIIKGVDGYREALEFVAAQLAG